ncbi:hypothetical protein [Pseudohaliea sp.]|uniref:hypothetical protein n=1 Tax=Pseudohaliea sp. TaxID=2740289 RepID=UPI0032EAB76C
MLRRRLSVILFLCATLCATAMARAEPLTLIEELRDGDLSLSALGTLIALDAKPGLKGGYGLCMAAGEQLCDEKGTVGYGLCKVAGGQLCKVDGSLGYGLCKLAGEFSCKTKASLGHGLCRLSGGMNCRA